jgi:hypothetical protein
MLPSFPFVNPDDDIHLIVTMKGCLFPCFYCKQTRQYHNLMQIDLTTNYRPNLPLDACHCMSLSAATQYTQLYLGDGYGLACAMASLQNGSKKRTEDRHKIHFDCKVASSAATKSTPQFASFFSIESLHDDDLHLIVTMKGFTFPQFYCMKSFHCHNQKCKSSRHDDGTFLDRGR